MEFGKGFGWHSGYGSQSFTTAPVLRIAVPNSLYLSAFIPAWLTVHLAE